MVRDVIRYGVFVLLIGMFVLRDGLPALDAALSGRAPSIWLPDLTFVLFLLGLTAVAIGPNRTDDRHSFPRPFTPSDWAFLALLMGMVLAGAFFFWTDYDRLLGGMMAVMGTLGVGFTIYARFWGPFGSSGATT